MSWLISKRARKLARMVQQLVSNPEWLRHKKFVDREFDSTHGVDTGGITQLKRLGVPGECLNESAPHIAVDPVEFASAIDSIDAELSQLSFVDVGSGKGRALLLASKYPFKRIIGVEFAEPLVATARANVRHVNQGPDVNRIEIVHCDARDYELPLEPLLIFLYNPFGASMMKVVAERARASLASAPRIMLVVYLNPFSANVWVEAGFTEVKRGPHFAVFQFKG